MITIGFLLLASEVRPGVTGATPRAAASSPWPPRRSRRSWAPIGGMLIIVDYFLTAAISSVSASTTWLGAAGFQPPHRAAGQHRAGRARHHQHHRHPRERHGRPRMAVAAFAANIVVVVRSPCASRPSSGTFALATRCARCDLPPRSALIGFAGAWLAFSGLESINQLSPAMKLPIKRTAPCTHAARHRHHAADLADADGCCPSPAFRAGQARHNESFVSELGPPFGGAGAGVERRARRLGAAAVFAANTALIGGYHVFLALAHGDYLPQGPGPPQPHVRHAALGSSSSHHSS